MRSYKKREVFPKKYIYTKHEGEKIKPLRRPLWKRIFDKILKR